MEAHLARMRAVNPRLNAVVVDLSEEAMKAARAADKQRARGKELGLLHGVPVTIKENVDYEGRPNPNGVSANMNIIAPSDSRVVRNLIATIKPTQGRIPAFNQSAASERPMLAHLMSARGPLARSVGDVRLALEVMSQRDPRDPWWVPAPLVGPKPKGPIKVALAKLPVDMDVDPTVCAALRQAADHLERSGYRVRRPRC